MSLNMFWFLPTHGDGHYLGTEEGSRPVDHSCLQQIAQTVDRLGFTGVLILAGRRFDDPGHPEIEVSGRAAPKRHLANGCRTSGCDARQTLKWPGVI